ncbi:MAG: hypothetical protein PUC50_10035 [Bacteroidales bacterium]|nr:hypothetical protein [Bacteroidales bacterium]
MNDKDLMKLDMVRKLSQMLIDNDSSLSIERALALVLNSETYKSINNDNTHLYYQSPYYVYSFLQGELNT